MPEGLLHLFKPRPWGDVAVDLLDIVVVTYIIYRALLVLRGTRAMQMGTGLGVFFLIYGVSRYAGLVTLNNLFSKLLESIILVVVVVFQNDIRRGLMRIGSRAFFAGISRQQESRVIDEVVAAATELARHRMGALICFEQDANLDEFVVAQGTTIDATVQRELLVSLFVPEGVNKLHDGAVVIRNLRVAKAGVFFPMPDTKVLDKSLGSRHRAALGITEETDAVVVVVSEERGTISFCFNGNIVSNLDGASLRQALLGLFGQRGQKKKKAGTPTNTASIVVGKKLSQTGSHRIVRDERAGLEGLERGTERADRDRTATGSVILAPVVIPPPEESVPRLSRPPKPMAPAKPIETPRPSTTPEQKREDD